MLAWVTVFSKLYFHRLTQTEKALKWNGSLPRIDPTVNFPSICEHLCSFAFTCTPWFVCFHRSATSNFEYITANRLQTLDKSDHTKQLILCSYKYKSGIGRVWIQNARQHYLFLSRVSLLLTGWLWIKHLILHHHTFTYSETLLHQEAVWCWVMGQRCLPETLTCISFSPK